MCVFVCVCVCRECSCRQVLDVLMEEPEPAYSTPAQEYIPYWVQLWPSAIGERAHARERE